MFLDACAIISMMAGEESAVAYTAALLDAPTAWTSPMAAWEASIILSRPGQLNCTYSEAAGAVTEWLDERNIELRQPGSAHRILAYAIAVAEKHGVGKRSLSSFDCFHYAYAKEAGDPLLTLDQKLRQTDVPTRP